MAETASATGLIGSSIGEAAAFAAGLAIAPVLEPYLQELRNLTWSGTPTRPLDPQVIAEAVAEREVDEQTGADEASQTGLAATPFATLVKTIRTAPDLGTAFNLWRRGYITDDDFVHALDKEKFEDRWLDPLKLLKSEFLTPAQVALAVVRSLMNSEGLLTGENPTSGGKVPGTPVSFLDTLHEAAAGGIGEERLRVMINSIGLPMALQAAANAYFRGIIDLPDFYLAVAQGDTRPAWGPYILEQARQILTAGQYTELQLRGYYDRNKRLQNTAKHGMSEQDSDWLYDVQGRGMNLHAAFVAERRGGVFNGPTDQIPEWAMYQLQRGNLRPEVYNLEWAQRESYPSAFVIRGLLTAGAITVERGHELFLGLGWPEDVARSAADTFGQPAPAKAPTLSPAVKSAQTKFITAIHKAFVGGGITDAQMVAELQLSELSAADQAGVADFFRKEHDLQLIPPPTPPAP